MSDRNTPNEERAGRADRLDRDRAGADLAPNRDEIDKLAQAIVEATDPMNLPRLKSYELAESFETDPDSIRERLEEYPWAHSMDEDGVEWAFDRHVVFSESVNDAIESYPDRYERADFCTSHSGSQTNRTEDEQ